MKSATFLVFFVTTTACTSPMRWTEDQDNFDYGLRTDTSPIPDLGHDDILIVVRPDIRIIRDTRPPQEDIEILPDRILDFQIQDDLPRDSQIVDAPLLDQEISDAIIPDPDVIPFDCETCGARQVCRQNACIDLIFCGHGAESTRWDGELCTSCPEEIESTNTCVIAGEETMLWPDIDEDGVPEENQESTVPIDNCLEQFNPGQQDRDEDGHGDLCDNCPNQTNPGQEDLGEDGVGDACRKLWFSWEVTEYQWGICYEHDGVEYAQMSQSQFDFPEDISNLWLYYICETESGDVYEMDHWSHGFWQELEFETSYTFTFTFPEGNRPASCYFDLVGTCNGEEFHGWEEPCWRSILTEYDPFICKRGRGTFRWSGEEQEEAPLHDSELESRPMWRARAPDNPDD
jgi:hypothetical protein